VQLTGINRYPVKSCRGEAVGTAVVEPWGLAGDRRWMVVDGAGEVITAREANRLLLVRPQITDDGLTLDAPDLPTLVVRRPDGSALVPVSIWDSRLDAAPAGPRADAWLSGFLDRPVRLVHLADPTRRTPDPEFSRPEDRVSFADGYPLLVTTEASLSALNDEVAHGRTAEQGPLRVPVSSRERSERVEMTRFRPNVVVAGSVPWAEDDWRRVRIGRVVFRAVKGCARCVIVTLDPETAARGKEPVTTLARTRRWDGQTWFGVNLVPDVSDVPDAGTDADADPDSTRITVGDEVEVLEAAEPGGGPVRPLT
jgi:uncharacterized protein YcbX